MGSLKWFTMVSRSRRVHHFNDAQVELQDLRLRNAALAALGRGLRWAEALALLQPQPAASSDLVPFGACVGLVGHGCRGKWAISGESEIMKTCENRCRLCFYWIISLMRLLCWNVLEPWDDRSAWCFSQRVSYRGVNAVLGACDRAQRWSTALQLWKAWAPHGKVIKHVLSRRWEAGTGRVL